VDDVKGVRREARPPVGAVFERAFCGVHVIDPSSWTITESGVFSILDPYLRLASEGAILRPFSADGCRWIDVGRPADLARANASPLPQI
jgi:NDP-sugar pyrophosphorylase family protein